MSAHPAPRATRPIRAETAESSRPALGPNQRGKGGGEVEASIPVMAMAHQRTRGRVCRQAWRNLAARHDGRHPALLARLITIVEMRSWSVEPLGTGQSITPATSLPCQQSHRPVSLRSVAGGGIVDAVKSLAMAAAEGVLSLPNPHTHWVKPW